MLTGRLLIGSGSYYAGRAARRGSGVKARVRISDTNASSRRAAHLRENPRSEVSHSVSNPNDRSGVPPAAPARSSGPRRSSRAARLVARVARDGRPRRVRLRHRRGGPDAPVPRLVRARDPAAAPPLDVRRRLRGVRDRAAASRRASRRRSTGTRRIPEGDTQPRRASRSSPSRRWRYETDDVRDRALALPRPRPLGHDRPLRQPRRRRELTLRVRPLLALPRRRTELQSETTTGIDDDRGPRRGLLGPARCPTCPASTCAASFAETRAGSALVPALRVRRGRRRAATTRRRTSGARSSGNGRCARTREAFVLFSLDEIAARSRPLPRRGAAAPAGVRPHAATRSSTSWRAAPRSSWSRRTTASATILAGYPWLADWGRAGDDRGARPRAWRRAGSAPSPASSTRFAATRRDGLVPSHFSGEEGDAEYDSVDASLWFILAVEWFGRGAAQPAAGRRRCSAPCARSSRRIAAGTRFGIGVGPDGLLVGDAPGPRPDVDGRGRRRRAGDAARRAGRSRSTRSGTRR